VKRPLLVWAAVVIPAWIVLVLCTHWEPVVRDGWGHLIWHRKHAFTLDNLWAFAHGSYVHNDPRLGQTVTLLMYTPGPWHSIFTPLLELSLFYLLAALALGRAPSVKSTDDALVFTLVMVMVCCATGITGAMLFYRPYTGNYLFGLVVELMLLVPYRFHLETTFRERWWMAPVVLVIGLAAGLCNEHTGPALALATSGYGAWLVRRDRKLPPIWVIAGAVGVIVGGALLFFAPGQSIRYNGVATQQSIPMRIVDRGLVGNVKIFGIPILFLLATLPWVAIAAVAARRRHGWNTVSRARTVAAYAGFATAFVIVATLLASPKQGLRLDFAPISLCVAGIVSLIAPQLDTVRARLPAWILSGALLGAIGLTLVIEYRQLGAEYDARYEAIASAPKGSTVTVTRYSAPGLPFFVGEDFQSAPARARIAKAFKLAAIELDDGTASANEPDEP
jgi:hypothetical protein